ELGAPRTFAPYTMNWDTATFPNGTHDVRAIARDAAGNVTTSSRRRVTVFNSSNARVLARRHVRGDLDGDGTPDLVFQHTNGQLYSWFMHATRISGESSLTPGAVNPAWQIVAIDDFNG